MNIRPYKLYSKTELASVIDRCKSGLGDWVRKWFPDENTEFSIDINAFSESSEHTQEYGIPFFSKQGNLLCVAFIVDESIFDLSEMITAKRNFISRLKTTDSIADSVFLEIVYDLVVKIFENDELESKCNSIFSTGIEAPKEWTDPGSGAIELDIGFDSTVIRVIADKAATQHMSLEFEKINYDSKNMGSSVEIESKLEAIQQQNVSIPLSIESIEMTVDALGKLQLGDVIRLNMRLDEPLNISLQDTGYNCAGFLGKLNGDLALELKSMTKNNIGTRN